MNLRLKDLREDRDMNQEALGKLLNVSQETYSRYERGISDIPTPALVKLARFYDVSVDYLLGMTNDKRYYHRVPVDDSSPTNGKS